MQWPGHNYLFTLHCLYNTCFEIIKLQIKLIGSDMYHLYVIKCMASLYCMYFSNCICDWICEEVSYTCNYKYLEYNFEILNLLHL